MNNQKFDYLNISKINNYIYLGAAEHPLKNTDEFSELGISVCINCAKEIVYPKDNHLMIENIPLEHNNISFLENMETAAEKIAFHLRNKRKIYIHCDKGIHRAPLILLYYLMKKTKMHFDKAYRFIKGVRPIIEINSHMENNLKIIQEQIT